MFACFGWVEMGSYQTTEPNGDITFWGWRHEYNGAGELVSSTCEPTVPCHAATGTARLLA